MTDEQQQEPQVADAEVAVDADDTGATVVGAIGDETGTQAAGAVVTDYEYAVVVAAFDDEDAAREAYAVLGEAESQEKIDVEGVLVIRTDSRGKVEVQEMTEHSTRTGAKWGAVGGLVVGIIFPPAILASVIGWGVVGGVLGKIRNVAHRSDVSDELAGTLGPNESGIVALIKGEDIGPLREYLPKARKVRTAGVDDATAISLTEEAKKAE